MKDRLRYNLTSAPDRRYAEMRRLMGSVDRVALGNLRLEPPAGASGAITVHFGEALANGRIERNPPGSVHYQKTSVYLAGATPVVAAPPPDRRNTEHPDAVLTPPEWGVIRPFRWVKIEG